MKKINSLEYNTLIWFTIRACFAELTMTTLLHILKQDTWISVLIGSVIGLIPFSIYEYLKIKFPNDNIITLNEKLWNKIGKLLNIIIMAGCIVSSIYTFWILIHFSNALFLSKTSLWIISAAFILPIGYAASKEIHVIGKISLIIFYISILFNIFIAVGLTGNVDISNMKPILEKGLLKTFNASTIFIGTNITKLFFLSAISKNEITNYSSKKSLILYIITCLNLVEIAFTTVGVFGVDLSILYEYPAFQILKRVNILGVFDRIESILSIEGIFSLFIQIILSIHLSKKVLEKSFNLNKKTNKYIIVSICLLIFLASNTMFITHESGESFFTNELIYILMFTFIFIPLVTLIKSLLFQSNIKQKGQHNQVTLK